ncbi:MAG: nucleotide exchange factor GrpE [Chloroflexi bacterium]|nr:MAG: nucleotide exchange factor GrpE [Chloroflexota bacterium]
MTEKKNHKYEEELAENEVEGTKAEGVATSENVEQLSAEIEALKKQLEEAESRASEHKDSWLRSQAEFQNYRKRIERDNEMKYVSMKGDIIKKVLPALDDLERALQNRRAEDPWADGVELIARKLQNMLENEGVKKIQAVGAEFDPNFHEAISHEPADGVQSGYVIGVVQNGYMLGERVIRPAMVRVAQ